MFAATREVVSSSSELSDIGGELKGLEVGRREESGRRLRALSTHGRADGRSILRI